MTFKEFCKRYNNIKIKYDIIIVSELINLYTEYGKEKFSTETILKELHDEIIYTKEQKLYIIREAEKLNKEQN